MEDVCWHPLVVKQRFEKLVARSLRKQDIEQCLPVRTSGQSGSRLQDTGVPLFPGYVFCKCDVASHRRILTIPGALSVLDAANSIEAAEIEDLQCVVNSGFSYEPWTFVPTGQIVKVESGPLCGVKGFLPGTSDKRRLVISIQLLRSWVAVDIDYSCRLSLWDNAPVRSVATFSKAAS